MTCPVPPDDAAWWDATVTRDNVLHQLRLQSGDIDDVRVSALIPAAGHLINTHLDRVDAPPGPPAPPLLQAALERQIVDMYGRVDPATALVDLAPVALGPEVRAMIAPFRQRMPIG